MALCHDRTCELAIRPRMPMSRGCGSEYICSGLYAINRARVVNSVLLFVARARLLPNTRLIPVPAGRGVARRTSNRIGSS